MATYRATATLADGTYIVALCDSVIESLVEGTRLKAHPDVVDVVCEALEPAADDGELQEILEAADGRSVEVRYFAARPAPWEVRRTNAEGHELVPVRFANQDRAFNYACRYVGWE